MLSQEQDKLIDEVRASLENAHANALRMRTTSSWLLVTSIITSAATTLVAAITAARGPIVGEGVAGWKASCIIAAVLGFATTVCVALNQQFRFGDRLSKATECAGRLKALEVSITMGSRSRDEIAKEYGEIVREYPEAIRGRSR